MLPENRRTQLDGIVQQMVNNGESDNDIQFVVNDFKTKYAAEQPSPAPQDLTSKLTERAKKVPISLNESLAIPRMGLRIAGQGIGAVYDTAMAGLSEAM